MINHRLLRDEGKPAETCIYVNRVSHPYNTWWVMEHSPRWPSGKKRYEADETMPGDAGFYRAMNVAFDMRLLPIFVRLQGSCRGFVRIEQEDPPLLTARHHVLEWFCTSRSQESVTHSILRLMLVGPPHWCHRSEERAIDLD